MRLFDEFSLYFYFKLGPYRSTKCAYWVYVLLHLQRIMYLSRNMRFPTIWYVRPAKPQISLRIRAVWSEPLLVAEYFMNIELLIEHHLEFLSLKGGCTGSSESTLVKMPHCWNHISRFNFKTFRAANMLTSFVLYPRILFLIPPPPIFEKWMG